MRSLRIIFLLLLFALPLRIDRLGSGIRMNCARAELHHMWLEANVGYPFVSIENPNKSKAYYDGIALRANAVIPIIDTPKFDVHFSPGVKYLDLENTASNDAQFEMANLIGPGAGLTFRYTKYWLGAKYYHLFGRHITTGDFSAKTEYSMPAVDYFAGIYFEFGRVGLGLSYSRSFSEISKDKTGLESNSAYDESVVSLQITFNTSETLWQILGGIF